MTWSRKTWSSFAWNSLELPSSGPSTQTVDLTGHGIASTLAFGADRIDMNVDLTGDGIASTLHFGTDRIDLGIQLTGIASTLAFGTDRIDLGIQLSGIASTAHVGTPRIDFGIVLAGIPSSLAFGTMSLLGPQPTHIIDLTGHGIAPVSGVGIPGIRDPNTISLFGIPSTIRFGNFSIIVQPLPENSILDTNIPWAWVNSDEKYQLYVWLVNFISNLKKKDESIIQVTASPVGVVSARPGTIALNLGGGAGNTLWVKESALDATGWVNVA